MEGTEDPRKDLLITQYAPIFPKDKEESYLAQLRYVPPRLKEGQETEAAS